ncbi:hypothetical protein WICMUC_001157 [Wickerhamomyces mucosus]|uniref:Copper-fist domain-containing protein n=1 Tax=Wickerhamomyces mucosus TaxID=1378264 RepID=A0A9P8TI28_9ASCO|nr:hypothetical protein WICMUC_001157 [Wickerhamomyces mucosus]
MLLLKDERIACVQCIRGHRAADCLHIEKPLISIKSRGRPPAHEKNIRCRYMFPSILKVCDKEVEKMNGRALPGQKKLTYVVDESTPYTLIRVRLGKGFEVISELSKTEAVEFLHNKGNDFKLSAHNYADQGLSTLKSQKKVDPSIKLNYLAKQNQIIQDFTGCSILQETQSRGNVDTHHQHFNPQIARGNGNYPTSFVLQGNQLNDTHETISNPVPCTSKKTVSLTESRNFPGSIHSSQISQQTGLIKDLNGQQLFESFNTYFNFDPLIMNTHTTYTFNSQLPINDLIKTNNLKRDRSPLENEIPADDSRRNVLQAQVPEAIAKLSTRETPINQPCSKSRTVIQTHTSQRFINQDMLVPNSAQDSAASSTLNSDSDLIDEFGNFAFLLHEPQTSSDQLTNLDDTFLTTESQHRNNSIPRFVPFDSNKIHQFTQCSGPGELKERGIISRLETSGAKLTSPVNEIKSETPNAPSRCYGEEHHITLNGNIDEARNSKILEGTDRTAVENCSPEHDLLISGEASSLGSNIDITRPNQPSISHRITAKAEALDQGLLQGIVFGVHGWNSDH